MTTSRQHLRIRGPAEMVQAVPYLLGFHPAESLVLIGLGGGLLQVTARVDLPDALVGAVDATVASMGRGGVGEIVGIVYADPNDPDASATVDAVVDALGDAGSRNDCVVKDVLLVGDGRWRSLSCHDDRCCPAAGRPLPEAPSAFAVAAVSDGVVALPDRAALRAVLEPRPAAERAVLRPLVEQRLGRAPDVASGRRGRRFAERELLARARASEVPGWLPPGDEETAEWGAALMTVAMRDVVWMAIERRELDGRALLRHLARSLPCPYDAPAMFLYGWSSWRAGDGALARIAADAAVASDPGYTPADMLLAALSWGVDPRRVPRVRIPRPA